jgi:Holliday junction DNA helicase RuvA
MIAHLRGHLQSVDVTSVLLQCGAVTYEVLVPASDIETLREQVGAEVGLHTLHYLEAHGQGTTLLPRLVGFLTQQDRAFFQLFTSVKGVGNRKALRAMTLEPARIAGAIAARDTALLVSLPEIGKRTAETIIASLHDRVDTFLTSPTPQGPRSEAGVGFLQDAVTMLVMLGEPPAQARLLVEEALRITPQVESAQDLVESAYQLRS